ncbi:N-terminal phage integrase SAM-like domain-containing protein [Lysinibacillus sp. NPDC092081]|uniref:N-terminal phage integrase SAM-like domain-containing protein n=1 Tax=Lysinibacillus sp. NPDC092081 TaxID=3364131 RepID=UPI003800CE08
MEEYVDLKLEPNTYYNYEGVIKNHILPHLGKYKVKSLTTHVLQQFINLSLNHAVYPYKYIKENPMHYVELLKDKSRKPPVKI